MLWQFAIIRPRRGIPVWRRDYGLIMIRANDFVFLFAVKQVDRFFITGSIYDSVEGVV